MYVLKFIVKIQGTSGVIRCKEDIVIKTDLMSIILIVENIVLANLETNFEHLVDYGLWTNRNI